MCQKHIGNAKRMYQKLKWSDLTGPINIRKNKLTIKNTDDHPCSLSLTYISLNCSARLSQINMIFGTFFSHCQNASGASKPPGAIFQSSLTVNDILHRRISLPTLINCRVKPIWGVCSIESNFKFITPADRTNKFGTDGKHFYLHARSSQLFCC